MGEDDICVKSVTFFPLLIFARFHSTLNVLGIPGIRNPKFGLPG